MKIITFTLFVLYISSCTSRQSFSDNIPPSDTTCLHEIAKAKQDIKENKLIYSNLWGFGGSPLRYEKELDSLLSLYNIEYGDFVFSCFEDVTENCYYPYMNEEIEYRYGKYFIDSLENVADSIYTIKYGNDK